MRIKNDDKKSNLAFNYEIERLLNRRIIVINRINYLMKWKNYDSKHNVWYFLHVLNDCQNLITQYNETHSRSTFKSSKTRSRQINLFVKQYVIMSNKQLIDNILSNTQKSSNMSTNSSFINTTLIVIISTTRSITKFLITLFELSNIKFSITSLEILNIKRSIKLLLTS